MTVQLRTVPLPEARDVLLSQAGHLTSSQGTALAPEGVRPEPQTNLTGKRVFADGIEAGPGSILNEEGP